jgi:hypothetical protein
LNSQNDRITEIHRTCIQNADKGYIFMLERGKKKKASILSLIWFGERKKEKLDENNKNRRNRNDEIKLIKVSKIVKKDIVNGRRNCNEYI